MPFHHREFLLIFLPALFLLFVLIPKHRVFVISFASFLYLASTGWMDVVFVAVSICLNFLGAEYQAHQIHNRRDRHYVGIGMIIALNLLGLGLAKSLHHGPSATIPLGISFYTFEQIAFHIDMRRGRLVRPRFSEYVFFVSYLPHLVAGPLIRAKDIFDQIRPLAWRRVDLNLSTANVSLLIIGVAKKVLLADALLPFVNHAYAEASFNDARLGILHFLYATAGYGLQIYFDFSAYSDIAIAISLILGIHLPINFDSPLKSASIVEFWRKWHMSLGSFVRDYLYSPVRARLPTRLLQILWMLPVMTLVGLWHGLSWPLALWGAMHGLLLIAYHLGSRIWKGRLPRWAGVSFNLLCVYLLCLLFRDTDLKSLSRILGAVLEFRIGSFGTDFVQATITLAMTWAISLAAPNSNQIHLWIASRSSLRPATITTLAMISLFIIALASLLLSTIESSFVYFKF